MRHLNLRAASHTLNLRFRWMRLHFPSQAVNKDRLTKERRSWNMSRIRGKDTAPEKIVRSILHRLGFRFRLHVKIPVPSTLNFPSSTGMKRPPRLIRPGIVLAKYKTVIFVHGCFWHRHKGCRNCTTLSRSAFHRFLRCVSSRDRPSFRTPILVVLGSPHSSCDMR